MVEAMRIRKHPLQAVSEWFHVLGVDFVTIAKDAGNDTNRLVKEFNVAKEHAKANYRRLAFEHHPDRAPEEQRAQAEERFKQLSWAWQSLEPVEIKPNPPRPPQTIVMVRVRSPLTTVWGSEMSSATDTSTTYWT